MKLSVKPGKYIVAVSGGVDSVTLLDLLVQERGLSLVIAHVDHGIREDSAEDNKFVASLSQKYSLPYEYTSLSLGAGASEETARKERYGFLQQIRKKHYADAITTAHHKDDLLETALLNVLRGTGRKGLTSLGDSGELLRPMAQFTKDQIVEYAQKHGLKWREDSTNSDESYTRNWLRLKVTPKLTHEQTKQLLTSQSQMKEINKEIDGMLDDIVEKSPELSRSLIIGLSHQLATEVVASWLRMHGFREFNRKTIERVVIDAKTLPQGKTIPLNSNLCIKLKTDSLVIVDAKEERTRV